MGREKYQSLQNVMISVIFISLYCKIIVFHGTLQLHYNISVTGPYKGVQRTKSKYCELFELIHHLDSQLR